MELLSMSGSMVTVSGGSTNMTKSMVTWQPNIQMEESSIIRARMVCTTVTELKHSMMEYIEESSKIAGETVMDS
jgi:hypothetical protein